MRLCRMIPRFSLRTLVVFLLLVTSGTGLWWHWEAWLLEWAVPETRRSCAAFSRDGAHIATGGDDGVVRVWDVRTRSVVFESKADGHKVRVCSVAFSPDGMSVASGGVDRSAKLWNIASGKCTATCGGHESSVEVKFSDDGAELLTETVRGRGPVSSDRGGLHTDGIGTLVTIRRWHAATGVLVEKLDVDGSYFSDLTEEMQRHYENNSIGPRHMWGDMAVYVPNWEVNECPVELPGHDLDQPLLLRRRRPEPWWGVFYLWEFWLTAAFAGVFVWSVWRDRRALA